MAKCPERGAEVLNLIKTWSMVGNPSKRGEGIKLTTGRYECPDCEKRFRVTLGKRTVTHKSVIEKIRDIEEGLMQTLKKLRERIETLESEKANLLKEIEQLKKAAEKKADTLEDEVSSLREEVKSLKELLGYTE